jgi:hypothetical protein
MTLIHGVMGNNPCPVCLIKRDEQSDLSIVKDLRTAKGSQEAVEKARQGTVEAGEDLLKDLGLRKIDVSVFPLEHSLFYPHFRTSSGR